MKFWSKGLGKRTVALRLRDGEAIKSGDKLYVKGQTEQTVVWDYIMPLRGADFIEFVNLLGDRRVVEYLYRSPNRWRLYSGLLVGGVRFLVLLVAYAIVGRRRPAPEEPTIEVPPPIDRRKDRAGNKRASRRRLGSSSPVRPTQPPSDARQPASERAV